MFVSAFRKPSLHYCVSIKNNDILLLSVNITHIVQEYRNSVNINKHNMLISHLKLKQNSHICMYKLNDKATKV